MHPSGPTGRGADLQNEGNHLVHVRSCVESHRDIKGALFAPTGNLVMAREEKVARDPARATAAMAKEEKVARDTERDTEKAAKVADQEQVGQRESTTGV